MNDNGDPISQFLQRLDSNKATVNDNFFNPLRNVADTLVDRTLEILLSSEQPSIPLSIAPQRNNGVTIGAVSDNFDPVAEDLQNQLSNSGVPPSLSQRNNGVTIGAVSDNLDSVTEDLQNQLSDSGIFVQRITLDDLTSANSSEIIKAYLSECALFIQPFDYGRVQLPILAGGHLKAQKGIVEDSEVAVPAIYWLVPPILDGIEKNANNAENSDKHIPFLDDFGMSALKRDSVETMAQYVEGEINPREIHQGVDLLPTIYIENANEDNHIRRQLEKKLEQLWESSYTTKPRLKCTPMPWNLLNMAKEDTLKDCHGIIMLYGHKDPFALLEQIKKLSGKLNPFSPSNSSPGEAVAWGSTTNAKG